MEVATNYVQNFFSGYRVPDFSKLWRKTDSTTTDGPQPQVPLLVRLEAYLVRIQELALWIDPKSSIAALALVQLVYWYLAYTSSAVLNLTAWACILGFLYTTWVNKIWPEIRVEKPLEEESVWTPVRPEVFSAPELVQFSQTARTKFVSGIAFLRDMRTSNPGRFCLVSCFAFSVVGYLGAYVTTLGLLYVTMMGSLTIPGLVRVLAQHHPCIQQQLDAYWSISGSTEPVSDVSDYPVEATSAAPVLSNVYSKVQAQLASMVSSMNPTSQDVKVKQDDEEDDLQDYLPEVNDEQTKKILEEGALMHEQNQSHEEETSLEYSSLMTGLGPSMPDVEEDEIDSGRNFFPTSTTSSAPVTTSSISEVAVVGPTDDDEFLPTADRSQLLLDELDDEEENSSLYFTNASASHEDDSTKESLPFPGFEDPSEEMEKDDFEFISEDELAEALKK